MISIGIHGKSQKREKFQSRCHQLKEDRHQVCRIRDLQVGEIWFNLHVCLHLHLQVWRRWSNLHVWIHLLQIIMPTWDLLLVWKHKEIPILIRGSLHHHVIGRDHQNLIKDQAHLACINNHHLKQNSNRDHHNYQDLLLSKEPLNHHHMLSFLEVHNETKETLDGIQIQVNCHLWLHLKQMVPNKMMNILH